MHWFIEWAKMQVKPLKGVIKARVFTARALITPFWVLYATRQRFNFALRGYGSAVLYAATVQLGST